MSTSPLRWRRQALAWLAALGLAGAAQAAEMTLYQHPGFAGPQLTLRGWTSDISRTGFNDKTSSIVVESGRWEVCTEPGFRGACVVLTRGEYPTLDRTLNDRITSAREVGTYGDQRGAYSDWGRGSIQLFGRPGFAGRNLVLEADAATLARSNFDDRASSVVVMRGTWELCSEPNFRGDCRTFAPGRYADLGFGMARAVSSARLVRPLRDAPVVISPGQPPAADTPARAILYAERRLRGRSLTLSGPVGDLDRANFDDAAVSMYVESGNWIVCRDSHFRGPCRTFGPGRYDDLEASGFSRRISSARPGGGVAPTSAPPSRDGIELFTNPEFRGKRLFTDRTLDDLAFNDFNDRTESVIVHQGTWELCSGAVFGGDCTVFARGRYPNLGGLIRDVSSVRRIQ